MSGIFISYRCEDGGWWAGGLIYERFAAHFGSAAIFTDIDSIPLGVNFKKHIDEQVGKCDILLAVIGEKWLSMTDDEGPPRFKQRGDVVRLEIQSALKREIPVIPLLVDNTAMPREDKLPKPLREPAFRNGLPIRPPPTFDADVRRLIRGVEKHLENQGGPEQESARRLFAVEALVKRIKLQRLRCVQAGTVFQDTLEDDSSGPEMVVIPAGSFMMGSPEEEADQEDERPQHRVIFEKPFAMGKYAVTFAGYERYCASTGREQPKDAGWGREKRPVIWVSWNDAVAYCKWLSAQTGERYRLPSEAEWEYAARAGTTTAYWWGDDVDANRAHCDGCGSERDGKQSTSVGSFDANDFGLYDMLGNVEEWVQDSWHENYVGAPADGSAWESGGGCRVRMTRGGSWDSYPGLVRSASRNFDWRHTRLHIIGFRLAQELD